MRWLAAAACAAAAVTAARAADHLVEVVGQRFEPVELRIAVGDRVLWINREQDGEHSVLWLGSGEESARFSPGEGWSRSFATRGRHAYRCAVHPRMHGAVVVE